MKDPYKVLGLPQDASAAQLKSAYRALAKELHPDVNPGDTIVEHRFKEVSAAYDLLSNAQKRQQYDLGKINADGSPRTDFFRYGGRRGGGADFEDLVADLFGRRRRSQRSKGKSIAYSVSVPFLEAVLGSIRRIRLQDGKTLEVNIPPGTEDGANLRLKEQGLAGIGGGPPGDALVEIQVEPHPFFTREGMDIKNRRADHPGRGGAWRKNQHPDHPWPGQRQGSSRHEHRQGLAVEGARHRRRQGQDGR